MNGDENNWSPSAVAYPPFPDQWPSWQAFFPCSMLNMTSCGMEYLWPAGISCPVCVPSQLLAPSGLLSDRAS